MADDVDPNERPPANWRRIALALVGLALGFILLNGGLNMLSKAGDAPATKTRTSLTSLTSVTTTPTTGTLIAPPGTTVTTSKP